MLDMFEKGMQPEYVDFHKDGKTILYGDSNKCSALAYIHPPPTVQLYDYKATIVQL